MPVINPKYLYEDQLCTDPETPITVLSEMISISIIKIKEDDVDPVLVLFYLQKQVYEVARIFRLIQQDAMKTRQQLDLLTRKDKQKREIKSCLK